MSDIDTSYTGFEPEPQAGYLQKDKVRVWFVCDDCGHEYSHVYDAIPRRNAPCPQVSCVAARAARRARKSADNVTGMLESGQTPGITGRNPMVGVIDNTAKVVMEDYQLTDLKDNIREGESMAPKLPGKMQEAADGYFSGGAGQTSKQAQLIGRRALAGAYRNMAVAPTQVFPGNKGDPLLRHTRTIKL